jgi:hypothetical protein
LLSQTQTVERLKLAKVCGNCVHGDGFYILRGRLLHLIEYSLRALQTDSPFLTAETVGALESLVKVWDWKSRCSIEKTWVRMFERGCANWEAST